VGRPTLDIGGPWPEGNLFTGYWLGVELNQALNSSQKRRFPLRLILEGRKRGNPQIPLGKFGTTRKFQGSFLKKPQNLKSYKV